MDKKRRLSNEDLEIAKGAFGDNQELVMLIRKFLFQGELFPAERELLMKLPENVHGIIRKVLCPTIEADSPLLQYSDLFIGIKTTETTASDVYPVIQAWKIVTEYIDTMLNSMKGLPAETFSLLGLLNLNEQDKEKLYIGLMARNMIMKHIDFQLQTVIMLAGSKSETVEQTLARIEKNSTK